MKKGLAPIRMIGACPFFMIQGAVLDMTDFPRFLTVHAGSPSITEQARCLPPKCSTNHDRSDEPVPVRLVS
jgi:hypothetical protein